VFVQGILKGEVSLYHSPPVRLQIKTKIFGSHMADSKPVKQEVNGTVILPPLVFPDSTNPPQLTPLLAGGGGGYRQSTHCWEQL